MRFKELPTQKSLKDRFVYTNGFLFNKKGKKLGYYRNDGRMVISINGYPYMAHRIIFKLINGYDPLEIDHINRNPSDNRIENLREISHSQNEYNTNLRSTNKTGIKGVCFSKERNKWVSTITNNYKTINLGRFNCLGLAIKARKKAEAIYIDS